MGQRIVIVGGGFAGAYCARELERRLRGMGAEIILLDRNNYFPFYPLLIEAGTGGLEPRHAVVAIRAMLRGGGARFVMAEVTGADLGGKTITFRRAEAPTEEMRPFDHLVLALGSITSLPPVPGLVEYAYQIKSIAEAVAIRDRVIRMLEAAAGLRPPTPDAPDAPPEQTEATLRGLLHFVVVGGNFTGAEMAGELDSFLHEAIRRHYPSLRGKYKVTLVERSERILAALGPALGDYAAANLRKRGVDVRLHTSAVAITADTVTLNTTNTTPNTANAPSANSQSHEMLPARTVIWAAGIAPPPLVKRLAVPVNAHGYIVCERDGRVKGFEHVWGIGDAAVNPLPGDARGRGYPATAQHAIKEGRAAARNIARAIRGQPTQPIDIRSQGSLAALGRRTGVADIFGVKVSGFPAWWLWRTVYMTKMPGLGRKTRVVLDWTLDLFFKRDVVQLGIHPPPPPPRGGGSAEC